MREGPGRPRKHTDHTDPDPEHWYFVHVSWLPLGQQCSIEGKLNADFWDWRLIERRLRPKHRHLL
jgi:hypothetical protein